MINENSDVVRIISTDAQGNEIVQYALPQQARTFGRMSFEQHGNVAYEGISFDELPEELRETYRKAAKTAPKI